MELREVILKLADRIDSAHLKIAFRPWLFLSENGLYYETKPGKPQGCTEPPVTVAAAFALRCAMARARS